MTPESCPNCGADVPRNAKACPECGADESSGWSEDASADRLGLPDENFNYDDYVKREFGPKSVKPRGLAWVWWITGVGLLVLILYLWLR